MRHFLVRDGLAQSQVTGLYQDPRGYLWISTLGGLSRFDGRRFVTYTTLDGMPDDVVTALTGDERGVVWFGTDSGHLGFRDREEMRTVTATGSVTEGAIIGLAPLANGRIAIATATAVEVRDIDGSVVGALSAPVRSMTLTPDGGCWVVADKVYRLASDATAPQVWQTDGIAAERIAAIAGTARHDFLALDDGTLLSRPAGQPWTQLADTGIRGVRFLLVSSSGELWLGSDSGLWLVAARGDGRAVPMRADNGRISVRVLLEDREGNLWIGTWGQGLYQLTGRAFTVLDHSSGLPSDTVWGMYEDPERCMWLATEEAGVVRWCAGGVAQVLRPGHELPPAPAISLAGGTAGALYIGTANGLVRWRRNEPLRLWTVRDGLPDNYVTALATDRDGTLWAATKGGLVRLAHDTVQSWTRADGLPDDSLRDIAIDRSDRVWVASHAGGLARFDGRGFLRISRRDGLPHDRVWCVTVDSRDRVWAGTDRGIWTRPAGGGSERLIGVGDGLPSQNVLFIVEDAEGMMWAGTTRGVARISAVGQVERVFTAADGLSSSEAAEGAATLAHDGRIWLGMASGVTIVDTRQLRTNPYPPLLAIEALSVNGKRWGAPFPIASGTPSPEPFLHLPPGSEEVRFDFAALSLTSPEKVRYRLQLEGYEQHATLSEDTHVTYRGLGPRRYRFVLTAENNDDVWTYEPLAVTFTVRPAWHATWWFRGSAFAVLVFGLAAAVHARIRRARRRRNLLEQEVTTRTAELNEAYRRIAEQNIMLQELSRTDPLTGLANRRVMAEQLPTEMAVRRREALRGTWLEWGRPRGAALYLLDLDHFKRVNDEFGHDVGDRYLIEAANAIGDTLRDVDLAVRWGGEELLILARGVDAAGVTQLARHLLEAVAATRVRLESGEDVALTASIGFVSYPLSGSSFLPSSEWLRLVEAVDRLLYLAKMRGRARACGLRWSAHGGAELGEEAMLDAIIADPETSPPGLESITEVLPTS
jgi:diguanylate cyclase (GGDEF)-like protein